MTLKPDNAAKSALRYIPLGVWLNVGLGGGAGLGLLEARGHCCVGRKWRDVCKTRMAGLIVSSVPAVQAYLSSSQSGQGRKMDVEFG